VHERIAERARERGDEHLLTRHVAQRRRKTADEDTRVRPDRRLRVSLHLGEEAEEVVVRDAVAELRACSETMRDKGDGGP
jgi:hypothetical protein